MKDFDSLISKAEQEFEQGKNELEKIKQQFLDVVTEHIKKWYVTESRKIITRESEKAKSLGIDRLKVLKEQVNQLVEETENLVQQHLNKDRLWWHQNEFDYVPYEYRYRLPKNIDNEIKEILGNLARVFGKDGLVKIKGSNSYREHGLWLENGRFVYPYGNPLNDEVHGVYLKYNDVVEGLLKVKSTIDSLKKEKEETNIVDIWDSI